MSVWEVVAWVGQALFFSRFFVQWIASERAKRSVAPPSFWWLSLAGTSLSGLYSFATDKPLFLAVFLVNFAIYARNITLGSRVARALSPPVAAAIALAAFAALWFGGALEPREHANASTTGVWLWINSLGAVLWGGRFLLQWWYAERRGLSHFPLSFWWVSLIGNAAMLAVTLHIGELVLIVGFLTGPFVQVRNLVLEYRRRAREGGAPHDDVALPERELVPAAPKAAARVDQAPPSRRR